VPAYGILNPGFNSIKTSSQPGRPAIYVAGRWILKKNPDREFDEDLGTELTDNYEGGFSKSVPFPVNKIAIDWNNPKTDNPIKLTHSSVPSKKVSTVDELCLDCHDGDGGLHDAVSLVYSEDMALRGETGLNSYTKVYGHDSQTGRCDEKTVFDPEDGCNNGPDCRSCHRGGGDCELCHVPGKLPDIKWPREAYAMDPKVAEEKDAQAELGPNYQGTTFELNNFKLKHTVNWDPEWKSSDVRCSPECASFGLSWPHRTLSWKMLKNELFGIGFDGQEIGVGERRAPTAKHFPLGHQPAYDLDSSCTDCHNPLIWRPSAKEAFTKGLP
ncbi:MAG TPA: hypothetical protein VE439_09535, partial [Anaerolineae bacterium]|nr:hypothetical protein [Anaerolineae bacterium]